MNQSPLRLEIVSLSPTHITFKYDNDEYTAVKHIVGDSHQNIIYNTKRGQYETVIEKDGKPIVTSLKAWLATYCTIINRSETGILMK